MSAYGKRVDAVAEGLRERSLDGLLVSAPANVRYLTGYTGSNGLALVLAGAKDHRFFTDFRYEAQAAEEVAELFVQEIAPVDLLATVGARLADDQDARDVRSKDGARSRLGFDEQHLTVAQHAHLVELLEDAWELAWCAGAVERWREVKDEGELQRIEAAAQLADEALRAVLEGGLAGRTEREVAIEIELRMRTLGAEAASFPTIVAAGAHGALPHAQPRSTEIPPGTLVTIDWGALLEGYCSDCTRTFATGEPDQRQREIYELVLDAQVQGLTAVRVGRSGQEVDAVARGVIERAGEGEHFGHGLGHGVGIEVHEGPRLSRFRGETRLRAGNVVTVEPGVYVPGELGVRIEDLVVVTDDGSRVLSSLPKALTAVT
jgi:Xaa-Pro aminopeptidase